MRDLKSNFFSPIIRNATNNISELTMVLVTCRRVKHPTSENPDQQGVRYPLSEHFCN